MDISANAQLIESIQNSDLDQNMHGNFELVNSDNLTESYKCMYRIQSGELELRHIFQIIQVLCRITKTKEVGSSFFSLTK